MIQPEKQVGDYLGEIRRYFQESIGTDALHLLDDDPLLGNMLDSIAVLILVSHLEREYRIAVRGHEVDPSNFGTLRALASFVERKTAGV